MTEYKVILNKEFHMSLRLNNVLNFITFLLSFLFFQNIIAQTYFKLDDTVICRHIVH